MTLQPNETDYVSIKLVNDNGWESDELFTLAISGLSVGVGVIETVVKIIDDDRKYRQIVLVIWSGYLSNRFDQSYSYFIK